MRILILGANNKGALENYYISGFEQLGHEVFILDIQQPIFEKRQQSIFHKVWARLDFNTFVAAFNQKLIEQVSKYAGLDVILVFKGMELLPSTLETLKAATRLLVNYNPDHPFLFFSQGSGNTLVKQGIPYYDIHFSYSQTICQELRAQFGAVAHWLPFGYMPTSAAPAPLAVDLSEQAIFIGAWDQERTDFFNALPPHTVTIIGPETWAAKTSEASAARQSWAGYALYEAEATAAHQQALASINLFRPQNRITNSHNMRTFEVPGAGGVLISPYTEEQALFFEPNTEALYYHNSEEIPELIQKLRSDSAWVARIKRAAQTRALKSGYDYSARSADMIATLQSYL